MPRSVKWEWHWSRETLSTQLENAFRKRRFEARPGSLVESETLWRLGRVLTSRFGSMLHPSLDPAIVHARASELYGVLREAPDRPFFTVNRKFFHKRDLDSLIKRCEVLISEGEEFSRPIPAPDTPDSSGPMVWNLYSKERLLEVVRVVWREGLNAYLELVADSFPSCGRSLGTAALGQIKLDGFLLTDEEPQMQFGPVLDYTLSPADPDVDIDQLPPMSPGDTFPEPIVNIALTAESDIPSRWFTAPLPPRPAGVLGATYGHPTGASAGVEVFGDRPVTNLAYGLLADDLARFGLVKRSVHLSES